MKVLRRLLGIVVMIAGILGLVISLAGLVAVWAFKPAIANSVNTTIDTLDSSITTSQDVMEITYEAFGATVSSVDALADMLNNSAASIEDTEPVIIQVTTVMSGTLPSAISSATNSIKTAQEAAGVLESSIKSMDSFRAVLGTMPLLAAFVDPSQPPYNPDITLEDSLGELAEDLEELPVTFTEISTNLDKADDNLILIKDNLTTMSESVALISESLQEYQMMIRQSQDSMSNLKMTLESIRSNLPAIITGTAIGLSLFLFWLLIAQIVILSQGWELFQGTAGRMESGTPDQSAPEAAAGD